MAVSKVWLTRGRSRKVGFSSLAAAALFLLFLVYSASHLVHHSLDESQATAFLALSIAKGCHVRLISAVHPPVIEDTVERITLTGLWAGGLLVLPWTVHRGMRRLAPPLSAGACQRAPPRLDWALPGCDPGPDG